jgi:hypothetical protein
MDFYTIISIVALVLFIILLTLYGLYHKKINDRPFPETQDICPKNWKMINGNCMNPQANESNYLSYIPTNTPGYLATGNGFNPSDINWESYSGAKNSICGKQKWANANKISWDGVSNYNSC